MNTARLYLAFIAVCLVCWEGRSPCGVALGHSIVRRSPRVYFPNAVRRRRPVSTSNVSRRLPGRLGTPFRAGKGAADDDGDAAGASSSFAAGPAYGGGSYYKPSTGTYY